MLVRLPASPPCLWQGIKLIRRNLPKVTIKGDIVCHSSCIEFGKANIRKEHVCGKSVIEVGSFDFNGSLRPIVEAFNPKLYIGVDIQRGAGVDEICNAEDLIDRFGVNKFDLVICTELLEHVKNWKKVIHNLKQIITPGGRLLITTRSKGFRLHVFPFDFWRYEIPDMEFIFRDFKIEFLGKDLHPECPGVFLFARKPKLFREIKPHRLKLFSMVLSRRATIIWSSICWSVCRFDPTPSNWTVDKSRPLV